MQIKILGCGPSYGLPSLSRGYGECEPSNPKNFRLRSSLLVREQGTNILIDSGPEVRLQLLSAGNPKLSAVLYTHEHYDHMGGADDLRADLNEKTGDLPVYMAKTAVPHFKNMLEYLFQPTAHQKSIFNLHIIKPYQPFQVGTLNILPIPQKHGETESMGYRIGDMAYSTDVISMEEKGFKALEGIKVWILGVVTTTRNNKHINLKTALEWIERIKPERAYLTHMGSRMDYDKLCATLPSYIRPAYDMMEIEV